MHTRTLELLYFGANDGSSMDLLLAKLRLDYYR